MTDQPKLYRQHKLAPWDLEPHYTNHVGAMTEEVLHDKADIAEELAVRDAEIERLRGGAPYNLSDDADTIVGLYAYDTRCVDSGIKDELAKQRFKEMQAAKLLTLLSEVLRAMTAPPYTFEDAHNFVDWVKADWGLGIDWL